MENYDKEELELLEEFENNEWIPLSDKEENAFLKTVNGKGKIQKSEKINLRLSPSDIILVKERAHSEGLPYQTLISSVIHRYLTGQLIDKNTVTSILKS